MTLPFDEFLELEDHTGWPTVGETSPWLRNDPLITWLEHYGAEWGFAKDSEDPAYVEESDFGNYQGKKTREFRRRVIDALEQRLRSTGFGGIERLDLRTNSPEAPELTRDAIARRPAGIAGAILVDRSERYSGKVDLLLRSDVLDCVCDKPTGYRAEREHYVCVSIRFRNFALLKSGEADSGSDVYKAQLALLSRALGTIQVFEPNQAFFIGRSWSKASKPATKGSNALECLIPVTLQASGGKDHVALGLEAVRWIHRVRNEGHAWEVTPTPSVPELRPNMDCDRDAPWHEAKKRLAEELREPTALWKVGLAVRNRLLEHGCADWMRSDFPLEVACEKAGETRDRLEAMIAINRGTDHPPHHPARIIWNRDQWLQPDPLEFFVDFETCQHTNDDFSRFPGMGGTSIIFMIGCGHWQMPDGAEAGTLFGPEPEWVFRVFWVNSVSEEAELEMIREWWQYMEEVRLATPGAPDRPRIFHWSSAETTSIKKSISEAQKRAEEGEAWCNANWFDFLSEVVRPSGTSDAFVVRGAWGFGLKAIGKALHKHGLIETEWKDGTADGQAAMIGGQACFDLAIERGCAVEEVVVTDRGGNPRKLFREIIDYNETDCRVMAECVRYLRSLG